MDYRQYIAEKIKVEGVDAKEIASLMNVPPDPAMGDFALPCFRFAKALRKSPVAIAQELAAAIPADDVIAQVSALNGYLNFKVNKAGLAKDVLARILCEGDRYGSSDVGGGRVVCIDYSSVNIAKPFHIGHLPCTVFSTFSDSRRLGSTTSAITARSSAS